MVSESSGIDLFIHGYSGSDGKQQYHLTTFAADDHEIAADAGIVDAAPTLVLLLGLPLPGSKRIEIFEGGQRVQPLSKKLLSTCNHHNDAIWMRGLDHYRIQTGHLLTSGPHL